MRATTLTRLAVDDDRRAQLAADVRSGLTATPKVLPPKWFYDARGSELFEAITRLPEYYQTRAETEVLERIADDLVAVHRPVELVELGSGASRKTRVLLEAMHRAGSGHRYVPFDVSEDALLAAAEALTADYPWLEVHGVVGDFDHHLDEVPRGGRRLVAFLGGTIGNLHPDAQGPFLAEVADMLVDGDAFLLGVDLVKDHAVLEAAYDDTQGVTAEFNRNVLRVVNAELGADFPVEDFDHVAFYDADNAWIEMRLRARREMVVRIPALDLEVPFAAGEELHTELSCKFTRTTLEERFAASGLELVRWETDAAGRFAVAVGRSPAAGQAPAASQDTIPRSRS